MKKVKKWSTLLAVSLCMIMSASAGNYVSDAEMQYEDQIVRKDSYMIVPYADVIQVKYRMYNGKMQYRRWNATRKKWVDPFWIDL